MTISTERLLQIIDTASMPNADELSRQREQEIMSAMWRRYRLRIIGTDQSGYKSKKELEASSAALYAGLAGPCLICGVANPRTGIAASHKDTLRMPNDPVQRKARENEMKEKYRSAFPTEFTGETFSWLLSQEFPAENTAKLLTTEIRRNIATFEDKGLGIDVPGTALYLGGVYYLQPEGVNQLLNTAKAELVAQRYPNMPIVHRLGEVTGLMYGTPSHERFQGIGFMDVGKYFSEPALTGTIWKGQ